MAFVLTPRLSLPTWGAPTDGPTRVEFNNGFLNLDNYAARDEQGNTAGRPTAGVRGRYYWDTDKSILYRDNGSAYFVTGGVVETITANSPSTGAVTAALNAPSGQTANIIEAKAGATMEASLSAVGDWTVNGALTGKRLALNNDNASNTVLYGRAAVSQAGDLVDIADNGGTNKFLNINASGTLKTTYLYNDSAASVIGRAVTSNANTATFSGQPILEVYSNKAGNAGAFQEFVYVRHAGVSTSTVARRLGMMFKIGEETTADQGRTGGMYIESSSASADNPNLVLFRGDTPVMKFTTVQAQALLGMLVQGQLQLQPPSNNAQAILFPDGTVSGHGYQNNQSAYSRVGSSGSYYWFAGGSHSTTQGAPGVGGAVLGTLMNNGGVGAFNSGYGQFTQQNDPLSGPDTATVIVGADAVNSLAMHIGPTTIQTKNAGYASQPNTTNQMMVQRYGGDLILARNGYNDEGSQGIVALPNSLLTKIGKRGFAIQYSTPPNPQVGDLWVSL